MHKDTLVLASLSPFRAQLLKNAGLTFDVEGAKIDERQLDTTFGDITPKELALKLAAAKAKDVSRRITQSVIIGCDQTLEFEGQVLHKAPNLEEAYHRLTALSGKTHYLHSGIVLVKNGEVIAADVATASMKMRPLSDKFIQQYLANVGEKILGSVGTYQIEGEGIQLFEKIEGDYFTIIGLPLLVLLKNLRILGIIDK